MVSIRRVVALLVASCLLGACGGTATPAEPAAAHPDEWHEATLRGESSPFGPFTVATVVSFPDRRTLEDAHYDMAESAGQQLFVVSRGAGHGVLDLPATIDANAKVMVVATYGPDCADAAAAPALLVRTSDASGDSRVDGFRGELSTSFESEVDAYCSRGLVGRVTGSEQSADGAFTVRVEVFNPGPSPVEVTSSDYEAADTHWFAASATIEPLQTHELVITGEGDACTASTPWETGHLTADGHAVEFPSGYNEQC